MLARIRRRNPWTPVVSDQQGRPAAWKIVCLCLVIALVTVTWLYSVALLFVPRIAPTPHTVSAAQATEGRR